MARNADTEIASVVMEVKRSGSGQGSGHGPSGFVGSAVAHSLVRSGFRVRALLRQASSRKNLGGLDFEIAEGDMRDPLAVARAMAGVRFLFHVAADYRLWARKPQEILYNNKEGTRDANAPGARG